MTPEGEPAPGREALAVDLDGTLLRTDTMFECIAALLRRPWSSLLRQSRYWAAAPR